MIVELDEGHVEPALRPFLRAAGSELRDWRLRSVHRRGRSASSLLVEAATTEATGRGRTLLFVVHSTTRAVPPGAAIVPVDGRDLHVWRFPDDPYLPGLRTAVSRRAGGARLERLGLTQSADHGHPRVHTRSYRPTRRAVVELNSVGSPTPALYLKVLGGRDGDTVAARTNDLVEVHRHLAEHLPVPRVLEHDPTTGTIALRRIGGRTLRDLLRTGGDLPTIDGVLDLVGSIGATPVPPGDNDPARYADVTRHLELLRRVTPAATDALDRIATEVAAIGDLGGPIGTVHGDLHDGQVVVDGGRVSGLLDVDGAGRGSLALDAGRLVANIEVAALTAPAQAEVVAGYAIRLADGLAELVPPSSLAIAAAAAWIGLATGPHRVRGDRWRAATIDRVRRAAAWTDRI